MPGDTAGVRTGRIEDSTDDKTNLRWLKGSPQNPGRDPKRKMDMGTIGAIALTDSLIIVSLAWVGIVLLAYSLRHHNV